MARRDLVEADLDGAYLGFILSIINEDIANTSNFWLSLRPVV